MRCYVELLLRWARLVAPLLFVEGFMSQVAVAARELDLV
jgi:hypothetical protein